MERMFIVLMVGLLAAACTSRFPQPNYASSGPLPTPAVMINAPPQTVQAVVIARAAARGSRVMARGNDLVLERPLDNVTPAVRAACGENLFGQKVRVVLRTSAAGGGTRLAEERYIVGNGFGGNCRMPLSDDDVAQSLNALNAVKQGAETGGH